MDMKDLHDPRFVQWLRATQPSPIEPDTKDFDAVRAEYKIPQIAPKEVHADAYRLAQASKIMRLWEQWQASQN
jgi:hypothetical protein